MRDEEQFEAIYACMIGASSGPAYGGPPVCDLLADAEFSALLAEYERILNELAPLLDEGGEGYPACPQLQQLWDLCFALCHRMGEEAFSCGSALSRQLPPADESSPPGRRNA